MIAQSRIFLGTFHNDAFQTVWDIRHFFCRRFDFFLKVFERHRYRRIAVKRHMSCDHLIHGDTDGVNIALLIHHSASRLLRGRIMHRSHNTGADRLCSGRRTRNAKVCDLNFTVF